MAVNTRPWFTYFDGSADIPLSMQADNPAGQEQLPLKAGNKRTILGGDGNSYTVGDLAVIPRNSKSIVWSSEGYTNPLNAVVPAISTANKGATSSTILLGPAAALDFSPYRNLLLLLNYTSLTAGTSPTIQFELDCLDDVATPIVYPLWKPTAFTASGAVAWYLSVGTGNGVLQAAAAPATAITNGAPFLGNSAYTLESVPVAFAPQGKIAWTVTGAPTGGVWTAMLYGIH